jgi:type IV fimbrial biogenesis protein FimT
VGLSRIPGCNTISPMRNIAGVTLIEMVFGLAIVGILTGLAVPGFHQSLRASAVRAATYELLGGLQQARGNSIVESLPGMLCLSDSAGNCLPAATAGAFWRWSIDAPGRAPELGAHALPEGVVARSSRSPIRFLPNAVSASNATLTICDLQAIAPPRAIVISVSGRARTSAAAEATCR